MIDGVFTRRAVQFEADHRRAVAQRSAGENAALHPIEPKRWDATETGHVQGSAHRINPFSRRQHVESHPGDHVIRRHPGKIDARELAGDTGATVGANQVLGHQLVGTIRTGHLNGDAVVMLIETRQRVPPSNIDVVFAGPLRQHLDQPGLLNRQQEHLGIRRQREIQRKRREHGPRSEPGRPRRPGQRAV